MLFPKENGAQAEWECYETYENNEGKQGEKDSLARVGKEKIPGDIRLVYLLNDAVESFLIFRDARLTGSYLENYEKQGDYVLPLPYYQYIFIPFLT